MLTLEEEAAELNRLLAGKIVKRIHRQRSTELAIEFMDQTRLFVDWKTTEIEMSVAGSIGEEKTV
jgi:hypothetical protein